MIRPDQFRYNSETAETNSFMNLNAAQSNREVQTLALIEFEKFVTKLEAAGIEALVFSGIHEHDTPDALFPNNWFSTHASGELILYPMKSTSRRAERRTDIVEALQKRFKYPRVHDLSKLEGASLALEGTGSLILDRAHQIAYAGLSSRTDVDAVRTWSDLTGYQAVTFLIADSMGQEIYHTNVMLSLGSRVAVLCSDAISDLEERSHVLKSLEKSGKTLLEISLDQIAHFCGNVLELHNSKQQPVWILSTRAWDALDSTQRRLLEAHGQILMSDLSTIETIGGGGARCMLAEIFAPTGSASVL